MFLQTKTKKSKKPFLVLFFVVVTFSLVSFHSPTKRAVSSVFTNIVTPFLRTKEAILDWSKSNSFVFKSKKSLLSENLELKKRNMELENRQILFEFLEDENKEMKEQFSRKRERDYSLVSVISRPPQSPYDVLIIDAGLKEELKKGMPVTVYGSILIGYVDEVFLNTSRVKLISFSGEKTNITLQKDNIAVVSVGQGGGNMEINIPNSIEVVSGDRIMSEGVFPLMVGFVERIEVNLSDPFQKIFFRLPVNLRNLKTLMVDKGAIPLNGEKEE